MLALAALAVLVAYSRFVEPMRVEVTRHAIAGPLDRPLRIAHLSDLRTSGFGSRERNLVFLMAREKPDIIVITGDTVEGGDLAPARDLMVNLTAPLGVWVVRGRHESWSPAQAQAFFPASAGIHFLSNSGAIARDDLWIAGLDDPDSGKPDLTAALQGAPAEVFKLVLLHAPDYFREIGGRFDLALAGSTLGGQVVLPAIGPLSRPPLGQRYLRGWFSANRSQLFVNRGVGTGSLRARFGARPELAIIELTPR